jgi:hypothetical protein
MSDWLPETGVVTRGYCPGCEPDVDPVKELVHESRCEQHQPVIGGSEDARATTTAIPAGVGEADGHDCRLMAVLLRERPCA